MGPPVALAFMFWPRQSQWMVRFFFFFLCLADIAIDEQKPPLALVDGSGKTSLFGGHVSTVIFNAAPRRFPELCPIQNAVTYNTIASTRIKLLRRLSVFQNGPQHNGTA